MKSIPGAELIAIECLNADEGHGPMRRYQASHQDFDGFVVPTVPALKQRQDTIATLIGLSRLGVQTSRLKLVFNMVEAGVTGAQTFDPLLAFGVVRELDACFAALELKP
jgi:hypothetical protein